MKGPHFELPDAERASLRAIVATIDREIRGYALRLLLDEAVTANFHRERRTGRTRGGVSFRAAG